VRLLECDKANVAAYEKISAHLKTSMKQTRQSKELNTKYMDDFEPINGTIFDKKN
jgi:hypothetical protein